MINEFVLPEKWYVVVTPENTDTLQKWKETTSWNDHARGYYAVSENGSGVGDHYSRSAREITFEQFKKYVLKEEFVLPEKWCIKITKENLKTVGDYYNREGMTWATNPDYIGQYYVSHNWASCNTSVMDKSFGANFSIKEKPSSFTEITFEQFKKYVLKEESLKVGDKVVGKQIRITSVDGETYPVFKEDYCRIIGEINGDRLKLEGDISIWFYQKDFKLKEETMERKIIGYKLIKPKYKEAINKIILSADYLQVGSIAEEKLREAGVLDLWFEPVYKEDDFRVGDWVSFHSETESRVVTSKIKDWTFHAYCVLENKLEPFKHLLREATEEEIAGALFKVGDWVTWTGFREITAKILKYNGDKCYTLDTKLSYQYDSCHYSNLRLATPEEIEATQEVKMPFGKVDVTITPYLIVYTPEDIQIPFKDIRDLLKHWDYEISAGAPSHHRIFITDEAIIQVGCMKGTFKQVLAIYNKMKALRNEA